TSECRRSRTLVSRHRPTTAAGIAYAACNIAIVKPACNFSSAPQGHGLGAFSRLDGPLADDQWSPVPRLHSREVPNSLLDIASLVDKCPNGTEHARRIVGLGDVAPEDN